MSGCRQPSSFACFHVRKICLIDIIKHSANTAETRRSRSRENFASMILRPFLAVISSPRVFTFVENMRVPQVGIGNVDEGDLGTKPQIRSSGTGDGGTVARFLSVHFV